MELGTVGSMDLGTRRIWNKELEEYGIRNYKNMEQGTRRIWNKELGEYGTRN